MLQRVEAEIGELGGFGMAEDAEHAAVIVKMIVFDLDQVCSMMRSRDALVRSDSLHTCAKRIRVA